MTSRVLLVSSDLELSLTLQCELGDAFEIVPLDFEGARDSLRHGREVARCIVVDARFKDQNALRALTELTRIAADARIKCVLLAPLRAFRGRGAAALLGETSPLLILSDRDPIAELLRTHLADPARGSVAARAHQRLLTALPKSLHKLIGAAFSIGVNRVGVRGVASGLGEHYTSLERHLEHVGLPPPAALVDVVKASYAVTRLLSTNEHAKKIARVLGYGEAKGLRRLLQRTFGITSSKVRHARKANSLAALLKRWSGARPISP